MVMIVIYTLFLYYILFFFKQKTAYELRISDWSSDVCSSDLRKHISQFVHCVQPEHEKAGAVCQSCERQKNDKFRVLCSEAGMIFSEGACVLWGRERDN